jgi:subtilase family serine protease
MTKFRKLKAICLFVCAFLLLAAPHVFAQKITVKSRVAQAVDDLQTTRLTGNVHPLARAEFDQGALPDSQPLQRMLVLLQRGTDQETALRNLLDAQQTKNSGSYHAWLTPDSFGKQFGPSDSDVQAVTDWLTRQGFQISKVSTGRTVIEFNGTVGQVRKGFQTEIHRFVVNGEEHFANVSDPAIPQALTPVVAGVVALHNFRKTSYLRNKGIYRRVAGSSALKPLFTFGNPASFALAPADFDKIYNIPTTTATGAGQTIAIVGRSNINAQDIIDFRNLFGLPQNFTQAGNIIVNGPDPGLLGPASPGTSSDEGESDLDVEWSGAVAPNATILLVTSEGTLTNTAQVTDGIDLSSLYIVDNNLAPILSDSYGSCEFMLGTTGNAFINSLWEQAAAQGITVAVAAGDNGSAGCDPTTASPNAAVGGIAVTGEASTPFNVAVGGTDFDFSTIPVTPPNQYWGSATSNSPQQGSALQYIPETPWDDSTCAALYPAPCTAVDSQGLDLSAGSGGPSNCTTSSSSACQAGSGNAKPAWQSLSPATTRSIPDVSFFASNAGNGVAYIVCEADNTSSGASCSLSSPFTDFELVGGTSAATPVFAAVMALVNQSTGQRQGNPNYVLYALASNTTYTSGGCNSSVGGTPAPTCVFHDVTKGTGSSGPTTSNSVACVAGSPNCSNSGSTGFGILVSQNNPAFVGGTGYDMATGLGSINVTNLLAQWASVTRTATTTMLTAPTGGSPSGTAFSATVSVTPGATGDVSLTALSSDGVTVLGSFGPFTLSNSASATVTSNLIPPNTAFVQATYGGDATHAISTSAAVAIPTVTGSNQASKTTLNFVSLGSDNSVLGITMNAQKLPYGTEFYILNIVVTGTQNSGQPCGFGYPNTKPAFPCPTGKITLTDNGTPLTDFASGPMPNASAMAKLNNLGLAEDQAINLSVGTHSVVASYAGDPNFQASTSNAMSITFTQASTSTVVQSNLGTITSGAPVTLTAQVNTNSNGVGPTGTVQFANGTSNIGAAVTCVPTSASASSSGTAYCTATVTTTISSLPPMSPGNRRTPRVPVLPITALAFAAILYLAFVQRMQQSRQRTLTYAGLLLFALVVAGVAGCGGGGSSSGGSHIVTINASYTGDTNYTASSGSTPITVQAAQ